MTKNSGDGGFPRNIAIGLTAGEYIYFMDSDDILLENALETFHKLSKDFEADVFHFEKYYEASGETVTTDKSILKERAIRETDFVNKPTFFTENLAERVRIFSANRFGWTPWSFFIRRDFLIKNPIRFPSDVCLEDGIFGFYLICVAGKILVTPDIIYVWRYRENSMCHGFFKPYERMFKRAESIFRTIYLLDEFMNKFELFKKSPEYKYAVFELFTAMNIDAINLNEFYSKIQPQQIDELIRREIEKQENPTAALAFIFNRMNIFNVNLNQQQQIIFQQQQLINQLQARLQK